MKLASTIGFLFGTPNSANDFMTVDPCSGFTRKRYLSSGRTESPELVHQAHPKLYIEALVGKVVRWLFCHRWRAPIRSSTTLFHSTIAPSSFRLSADDGAKRHYER
jgi:hypothetical protein